MMLLSDNNSGIHPQILESIYQCNVGNTHPYGDDPYTRKAIEKIRQTFGKEADVYFVGTGSGANVIGLCGLMTPFEGVICGDTAHINVDECGALERFGGSKILYVPNKGGKIHRDDVKKFLHSLGNEHQVQPRVISITQVTEVGTVYSVEEIKELAGFAHENGLLLHVDGARISNAAVALGVSLKEMITDTGVDLLSFGGTKNGMMIGEAIVSFNPELSKNFKFVRKQAMQLFSKMRFISAQFSAYLENDLWKENAIHANEMAHYLKTQFDTIPEVNLVYNVEANMIFANIPKAWIEPLQEKCPFYVLDEETNLIRLVTSFNTVKRDLEEFVEYMRKL